MASKAQSLIAAEMAEEEMEAQTLLVERTDSAAPRLGAGVRLFAGVAAAGLVGTLIFASTQRQAPLATSRAFAPEDVQVKAAARARAMEDCRRNLADKAKKDHEEMDVGEVPWVFNEAGSVDPCKMIEEDMNKTLEAIESEECSGQDEDCSKTQCCRDVGMQCYEKDGGWAKCQAACTPGPDPRDDDSAPWSCQELGERAEGETRQCSEVGENCVESRCCIAVGHACFSKNSTFAACKPSCTKGPDYFDESGWQPWDCEQLGKPTRGKAEWVDEECAGDYEDCRKSSCCKQAGFQCYAKSQWFAQCSAGCEKSDENDCTEIGQRTPSEGGWTPSAQVAPWVKRHCARGESNCSDAGCCAEPGLQCYSKDKNRSRCLDSCFSGDTSGPTFGWQCEEVGPRSPGRARNSWPTLFCFAVFRVCHPADDCYEQGLLQSVFDNDPSSGVFGCDDWALLSNEAAEVGGRKSLAFGKFSVGVSKDGTAANTELFMAAWDMLLKDSRFQKHDWTLKVDPDAVLLPWRMRDHLVDDTDDKELYVVNCNAYPDSDAFPMMYGSVEILSKAAAKAYSKGATKCREGLQWEDWGEDWYLTQCLDFLGVKRLEMFDVVGDNVCVGPGQGGTGDCGEGGRAAFHPFKTIEEWTECYKNAVASDYSVDEK